MERLELIVVYIIPVGPQVQLPEPDQDLSRSQLYITEISLCGTARSGGAG